METPKPIEFKEYPKDVALDRLAESATMRLKMNETHSQFSPALPAFLNRRGFSEDNIPSLQVLRARQLVVRLAT